MPAFPTWLNQAFAAQWDLRARWHGWWQHVDSATSSGHSRRPRAALVLSLPHWSWMFEGYDPGVTLLSLEIRHPFMDLRLANYLLAIPPVPWCVKKELLRAAARGVLPEAVRRRPKTMLAGDPVRELLQRGDGQWMDGFEPTPTLARYVATEAIPAVARKEAGEDVHVNTRPLSLDYWLRYSAAATRERKGAPK